MADRPHALRVSLPPAFVALGAALMFGSIFLPWLRIGPAPVRGYRLANLLMALSDSGLARARWAGIVWYLIPILAVSAWIILWAGRSMSVHRVHVWLGAVGLTVTVAFATWIAVVGDRSVLSGAFVAALGALAVGAAGWLGRPGHVAEGRSAR